MSYSLTFTFSQIVIAINSVPFQPLPRALLYPHTVLAQFAFLTPRMKFEANRSRQPSDDETSFTSMCRRMEDDDHEASRFITDPIHGEIEVPVVCQAFLHSLEFDRLRSVRQLGCSHYVFPGAKHSRMEHSLGVMHLAGEMMDHLMKKRPGCADETDKICAMMAGLCHDLGHGPFR